MISTGITGSAEGGATQLLDLLALVANPAVYEAKVKALQDAIYEHRQYVEAVAPVNEVRALKASTELLKAEAAQELEQAQVAAAQCKAAAEAEAKSIVATATESAKKAAKAATAKLDAASKAESAIEARQAELDALAEQLTAERAALEAKASELATAIVAAETSMAEYVSLKAALIEKHTLFINGL